MGKHFQFERQDSSFQFQSNHPGCLWAILHILDHHRWHNMKKMLPHNRNGRSRHPKGDGTSETVLKEHDAVQVPEYFTKEAPIPLVEQRTKDNIGPNKKLAKSEEKETMGKDKTARTDPSRRKIAKFKKKSEGILENRERRQVNPIDEPISDCLIKQPVDILEMFKLNKKLFAEMLRGEEVGPNKQFRSRNLNVKPGLTKSMSFPVVGRKLEHKQNESFPKGKSARPGTPAAKSLAYEKSVPDISDGSPPDLKQQGWNQLVVNRFNSIKQKLKQAFKEKRKGYVRLSGKEIPESSEHLPISEDGKNDVTSVDGRVSSVKQTTFSNESLERYRHLFAKSFSDNTKHRHFRSLTLGTGNKVRKNQLGSRSFNRNLSAPDLELFSSFFHDVSLDSSQTEEQIKNSSRLDECNLLDIADAKLVNTTLEELDRAEEFAEDAGEKRADEQDEPIEDEFTSAILEENHSQYLLPDCKSNDEMEFSQSNQTLGNRTCSPDHLTSSPELPISEGMDSESTGQTVPGSDSTSALSSIVGHEHTATTDEILDKQVKGVEQNQIENACYYQVRNIFEVSGLIESEPIGTCQSVGPELDQQLVIDLVNEALLDINATSSTYFHKAFSFNARSLPPPSGSRLLLAVWNRIAPHLGSRQELQLGQTLEDVVARDLTTGDDGWMKLQSQAEFLALDVEDLIIDQLLGELMCS